MTPPFKTSAPARGRHDSEAGIVGSALSMAKTAGALLTLIHVADCAPAQFYSSDAYDEHTRDDERCLLEIAAAVRAAGAAGEIALPRGDPARELINFAEAHAVEMLVMGSHRHRLIGELLWGKTVDPVRRRVGIQVLVVR